ncbi:hypothetical protein [Dactylosporangium sp. NPDC048998]|uniref:hypothetical protein n=1 Tax=Dactylosporangium sp. NPDC048998 TaxID=3363976 RepID=UPI00371BB326
MDVIDARSTAEAQEYMMMALAECGDRLTIELVEAYMRGDRWVGTFIAGCAELGIRREFEVHADPVPEGVEGGQFSYSTKVSTLIDAGEWYLVASRYLQAGADGEHQFDQAPSLALVEDVYESYSRAIAAISEILKFIPPGQAAPPDPAFWTERGRSVREGVGDQLTRSFLEPARARLEGILRAIREEYQPKR